MIKQIMNWFQDRTSATQSVDTSSKQLVEPIDVANHHILFLDVDGVLHPGTSETLVHEPKLTQWLDAHPWVKVVISSNWRENLSLDEVKNLFPTGLRAHIVGITPVLPGATRADEVMHIVRSHGIRRWCALDDDRGHFPDTDVSWLMLTESRFGLTPQHFDHLSRWAAT